MLSQLAQNYPNARIAGGKPWHFSCKRSSMFGHLRSQWRDLRSYSPGERFEKFREAHRDESVPAKIAYVGLSLVAFAIGVVLVFIPGPAVVFFALSAALTATQSLWAARKLDQAELLLRRAAGAVRSWWRRRHRVKST